MLVCVGVVISVVDVVPMNTVVAGAEVGDAVVVVDAVTSMVDHPPLVEVVVVVFTDRVVGTSTVVVVAAVVSSRICRIYHFRIDRSLPYPLLPHRLVAVRIEGMIRDLKMILVRRKAVRRWMAHLRKRTMPWITNALRPHFITAVVVPRKRRQFRPAMTHHRDVFHRIVAHLHIMRRRHPRGNQHRP